ncbi:MAG: transposase [Thaumarchaeota archaeon]|nr:transposase [Nitrososphaerota archaeon]
MPVASKCETVTDRTVVFGALAENGTRLMRQYEKFDGPTFVRYLREVRRKWGRVLLVTDNASQHRDREVRKYLEEHDGMEILYLPTATPKLSAVESV